MMVSFGRNTTFVVSSVSFTTLTPPGPSQPKNLVPAAPSKRFYLLTISWTGGIQGSRLIVGGVSFQMGNPNATYPDNVLPLSGSIGPVYVGPGDQVQFDTVATASAVGTLYETDSF